LTDATHEQQSAHGSADGAGRGRIGPLAARGVARLSIGGLAKGALAGLNSPARLAAMRSAAPASKLLRVCGSTLSARMTAWISESPRSSSMVGLWRCNMTHPFGVAAKRLASRLGRRLCVDFRRERVLPIGNDPKYRSVTS
jgi:hypothetical protein